MPSTARARCELSLLGAAAAAAGGGLLLAVGLTLAGISLVLPGIGLIALALLSGGWIAFSARSLRLELHLEARTVIEGRDLPIRTELQHNRLPLPAHTLRADVGEGVRLRRGRHSVLPPSIALEDPFGLARGSRKATGAEEEVLVLPAVDPPESVLSGGNRAGRRELRGSAANDIFLATEIDGVRAYRKGTPASRIHWPALARGVGLLERAPAADHESLPWIVLDARAPAGEAGQAALDAAVRATASLAYAYAREGGVNLLLPDRRAVTTVAPDLGAWPAVHARLGSVTAQNPARPRRPVRPGALVISALPPAPGDRTGALYPGPLPPRYARVRDRAAARGGPKPRTSLPLNPAQLSLGALALLALYGLLRWATLTEGVGTGRWAAMLVLAGLAALAVRRLPRPLAAAAVILVGLLLFPLAGFPLGWLLHLRVAVTVRALGRAIRTLPSVVVPYVGIDPATRATIALGCGALELLAGVAAGRARGAAGRALAVLPLLVLLTVPSALALPGFGVLHGLILFVLLTVAVLGVRRGRGALPLLVMAAAIAVAVVATLGPIQPALSVVKLADGLGSGTGTGLTFNWAQTYGPLLWPQTGAEVLRVRAAHPDYWKAEDLDTFDGRGWEGLGIRGAGELAGIPAARLRRYTQRLQVTLTGMSSTDVIGAGHLFRPGVSGLAEGSDAGTWTSVEPLGSGDSYAVRVYDPTPSPAQLAAAGTAYPPDIQAFTTVPFEAADAPAQALAESLDPPGATPYAFAVAVIGYLRHHESYDLDPPQAGGFPLISFLFSSHQGYCQQFAGAMAMLLRMRGVPARVAVGFTTGSRSRGVYHVTDTDAHAWVEVYFPGWGWVDFDPTPPSPGAGADAGAVAAGASKVSSAPLSSTHPRTALGGASPGPTRRTDTRTTFPTAATVAAILTLLALTGILVWRRRPPVTLDGLLAEVEVAHAAARRPLSPGTTLMSEAQRLDGAAAGYLRALCAARYAPAASLGLAPEAVREGRRALRRSLARGAGARLRLAFALPPWRRLS